MEDKCKLDVLVSIQKGLPSGYAIVPIQPTEAMLLSAAEEYGDLDITVGDIQDRLVFAHQAMVRGFMLYLGGNNV